MADLLVNSAITHSLLLILPVACALLLRWARCPGSAVLGGAIAGLLIGPTIFGRLAPDLFEARFVGGVAERVERDEVLRLHEADRTAALATQRDAAVLQALAARHGAERAEAEAAWREAQWSFQRPLRSYASAMVVLALLTGGLMRPARDAPGAPGPGLVAPASIGLWAFVLPGALAFGALRWFWNVDTAPAALAAAAVGVGPWLLTSIDRDAADRAEIGGARLVGASGRVASLMALGVTAAVMGALLGPKGLGWTAPLLALPAGWLLPRATGAPWLRPVVEIGVLPGLAACVALRVDVNLHFDLGIVVLLAILSGDGRWLGAFVGATLLGGRTGLRTMRLVLGAMACGPTQLAVASVASLTWSLPEPIVLGLLVGAVVVEVTAPARRSFARQLVEAEQQRDDAD